VAPAAVQQKVTRSIRLTTRGKVFLFAGAVFVIVAYGASNSLLLLVACLLFSLTVIAALLARFRSMKLAMARSFNPSPVSATTPTMVTIDATNLATIRSAPLYWNDTLPWRPLATDPVHLDPLAGLGSAWGKHSRLTYELTPPRRGVFRIGPLAVAYSDPFGLAVGFMTIGAKDELVVTPHVTELPLSGVWLEAPDGAARLVQASGVGNSDDLMTREYRRGDALRRVHWRASARHGELMVRQEEQRAYPEATIVIDTREGGYHDHTGSPTISRVSNAHSEGFEWAVSMLASLGVHLHREGFVVHVAETSDPQVIELADDESRVGREQDFLLSLASVQLMHDRGRPTAAPAEGPVFAIVSQPDDDTLAWLLAMRRPFEIGVVFLVGANRGVAAELSLGGWRVIPVDTRTSPALAWRVLAEELGATSAGR
jgi:uncharacterized protein (DUF58 family)